jgi:hypothetical protein
MTGLNSGIGGTVAGGVPTPGFIPIDAGGVVGGGVVGLVGSGLNVGVVDATLPAAPAAEPHAHSEYVPSS